jgi:translation initiation factor 2 alpha subunit (eIF-2alpha)
MASISLSLEDRLKRFEERMGEDEERTRPKRTRNEVLDAAIEAVNEQIATESVKLGGHFRLEAQKQAQKEKVRDLEWLVQDLNDLRSAT